MDNILELNMSLFAGGDTTSGVIDPETLYTKQNCIGMEIEAFVA